VTVPEQILCLLEERAGKDDDKVGGVPHLGLLHLGAKDHQLGGWVLHLQLSASFMTITNLLFHQIIILNTGI